MTTHILIFIIALSITATHGEHCSYGTSNNIFQQLTQSCPTLLGDQRKEYCCYNVADQSVFCCDAQQYALHTGLGIIVPAIVGVIGVVCICIFCISCLCCSCCPWYKRRHRGTVYGTVHTTGVGHQTRGTIPPQPQVVNIYPPHTINQPVSTTPFQSQPPLYTAEPYTKQAPYNPNYPH